MELPQHEKYKVTAPMKMVIRACMQLMKTMGHKDVHLSFGGDVSFFFGSFFFRLV